MGFGYRGFSRRALRILDKPARIYEKPRRLLFAGFFINQISTRWYLSGNSFRIFRITIRYYATFSTERGAGIFSPHDPKYSTLTGVDSPSQVSDDQLYESDPTLAVLDFEGTEPISGNTPSLSGKVLLLNGNYEPLSICGVQKAIILIYLEKA